jgi:hypothetical protein
LWLTALTSIKRGKDNGAGVKQSIVAPGGIRMDTREFRENRSAFPAAELLKYGGQWVAFSSDGGRIAASAADFAELDTRLVAIGEDPEQVALEYIDSDPSFVAAPETA